MLSLPTEVLLVSGIVGVFVDHSGVTTRSSITWSKPPRLLAFHKPFIIAVEEDLIEVHNLHDQRLVQRVLTQQVFKLSFSLSVSLTFALSSVGLSLSLSVTLSLSL